ncbi:MAG: DUF1592 domain-containing protein [Myxococcaceae bacterium]|nr:DUF1592 domain-containing protein [Myxococcaceae bacterium]
MFQPTGEDPAPPGPPPTAGDFEALECEAPTPGIAPMRRLSHVEYRYVIEDLFGDPTLAASAAANLVADPISLGFSNSATLLDVKPVLAQQYMEAAETIAETVTASDLSNLIPCAAAPTDEEACATSFIRSFVTRAYRRPLEQTEVDAYLSGFRTLRDAYDFKTGLQWIISTALQAPQFLYRPEIDQPSDPAVRAVRPYELASRLSFFLWHSLPDEALLTAAAENRLNTREDVEREAKRMLTDPRAQRLLNFFDEWLDLDKFGSYTRDPEIYASIPEDLPALFRQETDTFVKSVVFDGDGRLETLLTADYTYANDRLAAHYGLSGATSNEWIKIALPPGRRGLWMQGGPLTAHDKATRTSIVKRGLRLRTALLCQNIPAPPNNVNLNLGPVDQTATQSERLAQHRTNPSCAGCHSLLDPVGQIFENVDAVGRLRTEDEAGHLLSFAGELTGTTDANGPVSGPEELMLKLAQSDQVHKCFATQMFRYVAGREETPVDGCSRKQAFERFKGAGFDVRELVLGVVTSDDFLFRATEAAQ